MQYQIGWLLVLSLVFASIVPVYPIKCYICMSNMDVGCNTSDTTLLEQHKVDCETASGHPDVGGKILDRCAKTLKDGETTRACYFQDPLTTDNGCRSGNGATICICSTDYCNGASQKQSLGIYSLLVVSAVLLSFLTF